MNTCCLVVHSDDPLGPFATKERSEKGGGAVITVTVPYGPVCVDPKHYGHHLHELGRSRQSMEE